jgi:hypothetical protein
MFLFLMLTLLVLCANGSVADKASPESDGLQDVVGNNPEVQRRANELDRDVRLLHATCQDLGNREACEQRAEGLAQELFGYLKSLLAMSNDTLVSQVAPTLQSSWDTVLNITQALSSAAEPGEALLDSKLRNLTSMFADRFKSLKREAAGIRTAHTNVLKAARRSYLPG